MTLAQELFEKGNRAFHKKDYKTAAAFFEKAIDRNGAEPSYWILLGLSLEWLKSYRKAEDAFSKAIQLAPKESHPYFFRGRSRYLQKKYQAAIQDLDAAFKLEAGDFDYVLSDLFLLRGRCFEALGEYEQALTSYQLYGSYIHHPAEAVPHVDRVKAEISKAESSAEDIKILLSEADKKL